MRRPWSTTEFWVMILSIIVQATRLVDLPVEAWAVVIVWIIGRITQKAVAVSKGVSS